MKYIWCGKILILIIINEAKHSFYETQVESRHFFVKSSVKNPKREKSVKWSFGQQNKSFCSIFNNKNNNNKLRILSNLEDDIYTLFVIINQLLKCWTICRLPFWWWAKGRKIHTIIYLLPRERNWTSFFWYRKYYLISVIMVKCQFFCFCSFSKKPLSH